MISFVKKEGTSSAGNHARNIQLELRGQPGFGLDGSTDPNSVFRLGRHANVQQSSSQASSSSTTRRSTQFNIPVNSSKVIDLTSDTDGSSDEEDEEDEELVQPLPSRKFRKVARPTSHRRIANSLSVKASKANEVTTPQVLAKRGRGRPRKHPLPVRRAVNTPRLAASSPKPSSAANYISAQIYLPQTNKWMTKHENSPFIQQLKNVYGPPITIRNDVDMDGPPSGFTFVDEYEFTAGTVSPDPEARSGCDCKSDNGRKIGCEHRHCGCLEDVATKDDGTPIGFPYYAVPDKKGCLRDIYLRESYAIYECNELCKCGPNCKTKVVQKGRQIPLEIFKTRNRGWGLRSTVDVKKGQFIDCYLGEVITDAEASKRERKAGKGKDSYLFSLDKFKGTPGEFDHIPTKDLYVVDGEFKGAITRFINHSCDPNLKICTVSFYRGNPKVYQLAFFALTDIPAWTEFNFNYTDGDVIDDDANDDQEDDQGDHQDPFMAYREKKRQLANQCLCGAPNCRGKIWF